MSKFCSIHGTYSFNIYYMHQQLISSVWSISHFTNQIWINCKFTFFKNLYIAIPLYIHTYKWLTIVSLEAKKKQQWPLSELFTWTTTIKLGNAQAKPPWKLAPSYYRPNTFLLPRINKPIMVEITSTVLKFWLLWD